MQYVSMIKALFRYFKGQIHPNAVPCHVNSWPITSLLFNYAHVNYERMFPLTRGLCLPVAKNLTFVILYDSNW